MEELQAFWFRVRASGYGGWYMSTLLAMVLYGIYQYWFDRAITKTETGTRQASGLIALAISTYVVASLAGLVVLFRNFWTLEVGISEVGLAAFLGLLQGVLFFFLNHFRVGARRVFHQGFVLAVTKSSILLVILASWFVFGEVHGLTADQTVQQLVAFVMIGGSIYLLRQTEGADADKRGPVSRLNMGAGIVRLCLAVVVSAGIALLAKYAVGTSDIDIWLFMFWSNLFTSVMAFVMGYADLRRQARDPAGGFRPEIPIGHGVALGFLNAGAFFFLLHALSIGSASVVIPLHSLYIVIPALLAALLRGDTLSEQATVGIVLSITSLMLLK